MPSPWRGSGGRPSRRWAIPSVTSSGSASRAAGGIGGACPCFPPVPESEFPEIDPRLPSVLAALSPQQRAAVLLVHAHGWTQAETADALGCSVSTLRNHLERGMRRLRASLGDDDA